MHVALLKNSHTSLNNNKGFLTMFPNQRLGLLLTLFLVTLAAIDHVQVRSNLITMLMVAYAIEQRFRRTSFIYWEFLPIRSDTQMIIVFVGKYML
jgi:hypothetical protein